MGKLFAFLFLISMSRIDARGLPRISPPAHGPGMARDDVWAGKFFTVSAQGPAVLDVAGYEKLIRVELFRTDPDPKEISFELGKKKHVLSFFSENGKFTVDKNTLFELNELTKSVGEEKFLPQQRLTLEKNNARLVIYNLSGRKTDKGILIDHIKSDLLVREAHQ